MPSDDGTPAALHAKISTHILDTVTGEPARGVSVRLERRDSDDWQMIAEGNTDDDGRLRYQVAMRDLAGRRLSAALLRRTLRGWERVLPGDHRGVPRA